MMMSYIHVGHDICSRIFHLYRPRDLLPYFPVLDMYATISLFHFFSYLISLSERGWSPALRQRQMYDVW